jgi:hypothetical protein
MEFHIRSSSRRAGRPDRENSPTQGCLSASWPACGAVSCVGGEGRICCSARNCELARSISPAPRYQPVGQLWFRAAARSAACALHRPVFSTTAPGARAFPAWIGSRRKAGKLRNLAFAGCPRVTPKPSNVVPMHRRGLDRPAGHRTHLRPWPSADPNRAPIVGFRIPCPPVAASDPRAISG